MKYLYITEAGFAHQSDKEPTPDQLKGIDTTVLLCFRSTIRGFEEASFISAERSALWTPVPESSE